MWSRRSLMIEPAVFRAVHSFGARALISAEALLPRHLRADYSGQVDLVSDGGRRSDRGLSSVASIRLRCRDRRASSTPIHQIPPSGHGTSPAKSDTVARLGVGSPAFAHPRTPML